MDLFRVLKAHISGMIMMVIMVCFLWLLVSPGAAIAVALLAFAIWTVVDYIDFPSWLSRGRCRRRR